MPELPEVETVRRGLEATVVGLTIISVDLRNPVPLRGIDSGEFARRLKRARIIAVGRRAKMILIETTAALLVVHLKMSGRLVYCSAGDPVEKHTHIIFSLSDGHQLRYVDMRKFGFWRWVGPENSGAPELAGLGPEPLETTQSEFTALLRAKQKSARSIKSILLDQTFIAGIGNIYADEILHAAAILPGRTVASLGDDDIKRLYKAIKKVLRQAVANRGTSFSLYVDAAGSAGGHQHELQVYRRTGQKCYRCGGVIERIKMAGRGTHYCPNCQR